MAFLAQYSRYRQHTLFDRSWYGRVLVERVEKFCSEQEWQRAYGEINDFEQQLAESRIIMVKFWLATSKDEQLERFRKREITGYKRYKITSDDWRNRDKWDEDENAVDDMVSHASSEATPWEFIEANDKKFARIKVLKILCKRIEAALKNQK